jgi:MFS family permease
MRLRMDFFRAEIKIPIRKLIAVALLFSSTLVWFYIFHVYLLEELLISIGGGFFYVGLGKMFFYSFAVFSGILGSLIAERVERRKFLGSWLTFELLATISLLFCQGLEFSLFCSVLLGISFGLGFPTCQAFLTDSTIFDERGRIAGFIFFVCFITLAPIVFFAPKLGIMGLVFVCIALVGTSFLTLIIDPCLRKKGPITPWFSIVKSRAFASYALPWLIFQTANGIALFNDLPSEVSQVATLGKALQAVVTIFAVLISGFVSDRVGRKPPILVGFLMLGTSYAILGLATSSLSYFVYLAVSGLAWGLIIVSYMQVVLGDLSTGSGSKERYFALGGLMIPLFTYTVFAVVQEWTAFTVPANMLSSTLGIIVIASVIPVWRAPDTMSEAKKREKRIGEHIDKIGKVVQEFKKSK